MRQLTASVALLAQVLMLLVMATRPAHGQGRLTGLQPGDLVRLTAPTILPHPLEGRVIAADSASISVTPRGGETITLPAALIQRVQWGHGVNRARGVQRGAFGGAMLGMLVGAVVGLSGPRDGSANLAPATGFMIGAGVGAVYGGFRPPTAWVDWSAPSPAPRR